MAPITVATISETLKTIAPPPLAEDWDNVGLLVGDPGASVRRVMTCLTLTPTTVDEALREEADLVVSHHPLPFRPLRRITGETTAGAMLLRLIGAGTAVYSAHTAFDSGARGINQQLAEGLRLRGIAPLIPSDEGLGTGRQGWFETPLPLVELVQRVKRFLGIQRLARVGPDDLTVRTLAVGCGAADSLLAEAIAAGCDAMLLGEARFHVCLEAEARGIALLQTGHYASERFALEALAAMLSERLGDVEVWASRDERDPIAWD
jgi:dinuclear metal center YbgI/SA1388 family protein